jgi:hypothetical protein
MLHQMLGLMGAYVAPTTPSVTSVVASIPNGGSCSGTHVGTSAVIRATYAIANPDYTNYVVKIYMNGVLQITRTAPGTVYDLANGLVLGSSGHSTPLSYLMRVDVVRIATGAPVSSKSSTVDGDFGDCSGGA